MLEVSGQTHQTSKNTIWWESVGDLGDKMFEVSGADPPNIKKDTIGWESVEDLGDKMLEVSGADTPNFKRHKWVGKCRRLA